MAESARNAWGEPREPNPVLQIIAVRALQVGGAAGMGLAALATFCPPSVMIPIALTGGVAVSVGLSAYFARTFHPRTTFSGCPILVRLPKASGNTVVITFDDGPHPDTTPRLLEALAQANAHATFFVVGERASQYPELVRRMVQEGHTVGVHGLRHRTMVLQSRHEIERDLAEAVARISKAIGKPLPRPWLLRPPYGFTTNTLAQTARRLGFVTVAWSLDPRDYDPITTASLLAKVTNKIVPGEIVLLHERPDHPAAVEALPQLLALCHEKGLLPTGLIGAVGDFTHQPAP